MTDPNHTEECPLHQINFRYGGGPQHCTCGADKPTPQASIKEKPQVSLAKYNKLFDLFEEAVDHLEYCGYGDSYERECATDSNLQDRLREGLKTFKERHHG